jgi:molybdopterin converting factor subunit 1
MTIEVLYFAQAREHAGCASESIEIGEGTRIADALGALMARHPGLAALAPHLAVAVNGVLARPETVLREHAELALLPPVSGG